MTSGSSMIRETSRLLTKSGTVGNAGLSSPSKVTCSAPCLTPAPGEDVPHACANPFGIAHGAVAPLAAEHARREAATAVAGALIDGDDLGRRELGLELVQRKLQRPIHATVDLEPPRAQVHAGGNGKHVIAHEEGVVRGDGAVEVTSWASREIGR